MAITFIQGTNVAHNSGGVLGPLTLTATAAFVSSTTAGDTLLCATWATLQKSPSAILPLMGLPSTSGITWVAAATASYIYPPSGFNASGEIIMYVATNAIAIAPSVATTFIGTVTAATGATTLQIGCWAGQFRGIVGTAALDVVGSNSVGTYTGTTTSIPNGGIITTSHSDLVFAAVVAFTIPPSAGTGYTSAFSGGINTQGAGEYSLNASPGIYTTVFGGAVTAWAAVSMGLIGSSAAAGFAYSFPTLIV